MKDWYTIDNMAEVDTPTLAIYPDRVRENIRILKTFLPDANRLRPHVKTHKSGDVSGLMLKAGITKFKCATIAEAEMLADAGATDILLAYQPVGPKAVRLLTLSEKFPAVRFSCLIDNLPTARALSGTFEKAGRRSDVFIDLNIGMNRTGIAPERALALYEMCVSLPGLRLAGLHGYDGHIRASNLDERKKECDAGFSKVAHLNAELKKRHAGPWAVIAGGTPTFPIHAARERVECSPGTFVYWDIGYSETLVEQPYLFAALVITRVISKPTDNTICIDLGHKSIASENALTHRVRFLNAPGLTPVGHSEEHMVLKTDETSWEVGDVLYGVPFHVCPTCALYDSAAIVEGNRVDKRWTISSRNRKITI
jgi:D-serine deaminase-like pyridoxal phosphate-dependent protein